MALSAKKTAFISEYLVDMNGAAAAVRAGYSAKTSNVAAWRMLREPGVAAAIAAAQADRRARVEIDADYVVEGLRKIAESNTRGDSLRAFELLGKHLGLFKDRVEHSGPGGAAIPTSIEIKCVRPQPPTG